MANWAALQMKGRPRTSTCLLAWLLSGSSATQWDHWNRQCPHVSKASLRLTTLWWPVIYGYQIVHWTPGWIWVWYIKSKGVDVKTILAITKHWSVGQMIEYHSDSVERDTRSRSAISLQENDREDRCSNCSRDISNPGLPLCPVCPTETWYPRWWIWRL